MTTKARIKLANNSHTGWSRSFIFNTNGVTYNPEDIVKVSTVHGPAIGRIIKMANNSPIEPTQNVIEKVNPSEIETYRNRLQNKQLSDIAASIGIDIYDDCLFNINRNVPILKSENTNIKAIIKTPEEMSKLGFTNYSESTYYLCKQIKGVPDTTFNVSINKYTNRIEIEVLDENYLQHYDYQAILKKAPNNMYARLTHIWVQHYMTQLINTGIIYNYQLNDYI